MNLNELETEIKENPPSCNGEYYITLMSMYQVIQESEELSEEEALKMSILLLRVLQLSHEHDNITFNTFTDKTKPFMQLGAFIYHKVRERLRVLGSDYSVTNVWMIIRKRNVMDAGTNLWVTTILNRFGMYAVNFYE